MPFNEKRTTLLNESGVQAGGSELEGMVVIVFVALMTMSLLGNKSLNE